MANISFKSITFPGLANKYKVPEISNDLMTPGKAADSKATGDALSTLENSMNESLGANVSYVEQDKTLPQKTQGRENVGAVGKHIGSINKGAVLAVDTEGNVSVQKINLTDKCNDALFNLLSNIQYIHDDGNKRRDALMSNFTDKVIELPSAYQQVLYLEATGTQYIVTNIMSQIPFECDVEFYVDGANGAVVGAAEPNVANSRFFLCAVIPLPSTGQFLVTNRFGTTNWNNTAETTVDETGKYHVHSAIEYAESGVKSYIKFGERYSSMNIASAPTVGYPICFFIQRNSGDIYAGLLFSAKFVKSGVVLFDGVPCVRKSDGKPGLYDTVNGAFYTNSGTGEFLCGPEIY